MAEMVSENGAAVGGETGASTRRGEILRPAQIFDPVARALDLLGDRWTLVLVRQLLGGPKGFQELRVRTGIAPKVLSSRLRQLRSDGFVDTEEKGSRSVYCVTGKGRTLAPIISAIASWWVREGMGVREVDAVQFTETSALSVLEALPNLLREERARGAQVVFEVRLSGEGGGVWTVEIDDGECSGCKGPTRGNTVDSGYAADGTFSIAMWITQTTDRSPCSARKSLCPQSVFAPSNWSVRR